MKNPGRICTFIVLAALMMLSAMACEEDNAPDEPAVQAEEAVSSFEAVIGPAGGQVEISDPASPIYRAGAYVQPDILLEDVPITVSWQDMHGNWNADITAAGEVVRFDPDGIRFGQPVELVLPYKDADNDGIIDGTGIEEDNVRAMFFNTQTDMWKDLPVKTINTEDNTIRIETDHFSDYTAATYLARVCSESETLTCGPYYFSLYYDFRHGSDAYWASVSGVGADLNAKNADIIDEYHAVLEEAGFAGLFEQVLDAREWTWTWELIPSLTFLTKSMGIEDDEIEVNITVTGATSFEFSWNFDHTQMAPDEMLVVKFRGATDTLCQLLDRTPRAPQNVKTGTITDTSITISWDEIIYLYSSVSYNVYISEDGGNTFSLLTITGSPSVTASGLGSATAYSFKVTAVYHGTVESADSQTVSATTL